ncbi:MAG: hypothetical protein ACRDS0_38750, partial [Pseudonocardiaceae bacterium]
MIKPEQQPAPVAPTQGPGRPLLAMADDGGCTRCSAAGAAVLRRGSAEWVVLARWARLLSWISLGWLGIEGSVAILAAILAGSVALLGFGIDTAIEALASIIVVWRFSGDRTLSDTAEARAQKTVAVSFFLLAPYIAAESIRTLVMERHAETTWLGVALAVVSPLWCPTLGVMKKRLGARLNSAATTGEGRQNLL